MRPLRVEVQRRRRLPGRGEEQVQGTTFRGLREDRTGRASDADVRFPRPFRRCHRGDSGPEVVESVRDREGSQCTSGFHLIAGKVGWIKHLMIVGKVRRQIPATAEREDPILVDAAFERAPELEEVAVAPGRLDENEGRGGFKQCAGLPVPSETNRETAMHYDDE